MIMLQITDEQLSGCDVTNLERNFGRSLEPKLAKAAYGRIFLVFPKYDKDPREVWEIDDVRKWMRKLADRVPHFPFFLVPHEKALQMTMWVLSIIRIEPEKSGQMKIDLNEAAKELQRVDRALEDFCRLVREDYATVSSKLFGGLAEPLRGLVRR
jgi:hypothetical protein